MIITKLQVAPVELDVSSQSSQSSSSCRASRASRARRVERVELCSSTSSTEPKCMGSTRRMCRVESSQVEFEPYRINLLNSPNSTWLITSRLHTTRHVPRVEPMYFGCVERVGSKRLSRRARHVARVVSRRDVASQVEFGL